MDLFEGASIGQIWDNQSIRLFVLQPNKEWQEWLGVVAHTCNSSTLEGQEIDTILVNMVKPHVY